MNDYVISDDLGRRAGSNVFFSFGEFFVDVAETAEFRIGAQTTDNIIGRITDSAGGTLLGTLRSTATNTDIWLISPGGWTMGADASLDVPAAIYLSTADSLGFANGDSFQAAVSANSTLSISTPTSFGFLGSNQATLTASGTVDFTTSLIGLYGTDVDVSNLEVGRAIFAADTRVDVASTAAGESIVVGAISDGGSVIVRDTVINVSGESGPLVDIRGGQVAVTGTSISGAGVGTEMAPDIFIRGGEIIVDSESQLLSIVPSASPSTFGPNLTIEATGVLQYDGTLQSGARAIPSTSGDVRLAGSVVSLTGAEMTLSRAGPGKAGGFLIEASESIDVSQSIIQREIIAGEGGILEFRAPDVRFSGTQLQADTLNTQDGTGILVAADSLVLDNATNFTADVEEGAGTGIVLDIASDLVITNDSLITTESFADAIGAPITLSADTVEISDGGRVTSDVVLDGQGGTITIDAQAVLIGGGGDTGIFARSGSSSFDAATLAIFLEDPDFGTGDGGNIGIDTGSLTLRGGRIVVDAASKGNAGSIDIDVADTLVLDGNQFPSVISSSATVTYDQIGADVLGGGGSVNVDAGTLRLQGDALLQSDTDSDINPGGAINVSAGRIDVLGDPTVAMGIIESLDQGVAVDSGYAGVVSNSSGSARGGNVNVLAENLLLTAGIVSASASSGGAGGDVILGSAAEPITTLLFDSSSGVLARAQQGNGGNIFIFADNFVRDVNAVLSADSNAGNTGTVEVVAPELDISAAITELNVPILDGVELLAPACTFEDLSNQSSLRITGQGGVPPAPDGLQPSVGAYATGGVPVALIAPACQFGER